MRVSQSESESQSQSDIRGPEPLSRPLSRSRPTTSPTGQVHVRRAEGSLAARSRSNVSRRACAAAGRSAQTRSELASSLSARSSEQARDKISGGAGSSLARAGGRPAAVRCSVLPNHDLRQHNKLKGTHLRPEHRPLVEPVELTGAKVERHSGGCVLWTRVSALVRSADESASWPPDCRQQSRKTLLARPTADDFKRKRAGRHHATQVGSRHDLFQSTELIAARRKNAPLD